MAVLVVLMAAAAYLTVGVALTQCWCRDDPTTDEFDRVALVPVWPLVALALAFLAFLDWWVDE